MAYRFLYATQYVSGVSSPVINTIMYSICTLGYSPGALGLSRCALQIRTLQSSNWVHDGSIPANQWSIVHTLLWSFSEYLAEDIDPGRAWLRSTVLKRSAVEADIQNEQFTARRGLGPRCYLSGYEPGTLQSNDSGGPRRWGCSDGLEVWKDEDPAYREPGPILSLPPPCSAKDLAKQASLESIEHKRRVSVTVAWYRFSIQASAFDAALVPSLTIRQHFSGLNLLCSSHQRQILQWRWVI